MERVLVTGGAGFVGSNFVHHLVRETEVRVTILDRLTYAASLETLAGIPTERVRLVVGDVADPAVVEPLVAAHDAVVHFAAETHNDNALDDPGPFVHTNLLGTFTLLEAVRRTDCRFHHVSSDEVYGDLALDDPARFVEDSAYRPTSPYSATKAGADHLVRAWIRSFGIRATISSSSNNYGPWQHVEKFVPRTITSVLDGTRPRIYGDGSHVRDWLHTADHASAVWTILTRGAIGETYLIGADGEQSNLEVACAVLELLGGDLDAIEFVRDRVGHDRRYAVDWSKLRTELGWRPRRADFHQGLAETVAWYAEHPHWWRPLKRRTEATYAAKGQ